MNGADRSKVTRGDASRSREALQVRYDRTVKRLFDDPAVSFWLKRAIRELSDRDPFDAVGDAELLHGLMRVRSGIVLDSARRAAKGRAAEGGDR